MKITIVQGAFLPVPPLLGGAVEKVWHALAGEFAARGHEVVHVSRLFRDLPARESNSGVSHIRVRGHDTPRTLWRLKLLDLAYSLRVRRVLPPADLLVSNTFWLPLVARAPDFGHPYIHVARYPKGQLGLYPSRATFQTVSSPIREAIQSELRGRRSARIVQLPYPLGAIQPPPEGSVRSRVFLYAGRIHPEKGLELLIEAFRRFSQSFTGPAWSLRLVGPWKYSQGGGGQLFLERLRARAHGLSIEIPGPEFSHRELMLQYGNAAAFVYPSLAERGETFGLGVLEAMSVGTPPLVSNLGCFRDFVKTGENGLIFDHRDSDPADHLARTLEMAAKNESLRNRLGRNAAETAKGYALSRIAQLYLADFRRALNLESSPDHVGPGYDHQA